MSVPDGTPANDEIARLAGISQPYVFRLFGTKKELYMAVVARCFRQTLEIFQRAAEGKRGEDALAAIGLAYGELLQSDRIYLRAQMQAYAACEDPEICAVVRHGYGVLLLDARGYDGSEGDPNLFGWSGAEDIDAAVGWLQRRADVEDDRIGGISAIYSIDDSALDGPMAKFLIAGQRAQFSAFNMQNLLKGRNMAVLGGQFSIFIPSVNPREARTSLISFSDLRPRFRVFSSSFSVRWIRSPM